MATVNNLTTSAYPGAYGKAVSEGSNVYIKKRHLDCAASNQASGEYYHLFYIAANSLVKTHMVTKTVEGAADTADLCWVAATDTTAASPTTLISSHDLNVDDTCNAGTTFYTDVAGYISVKPDAALGTCAYGVIAEIIPLATTD